MTSLKELLKGGGGLKNGTPGQGGIPVKNYQTLLAGFQVKTNFAAVKIKEPKTLDLDTGDQSVIDGLIKATSDTNMKKALANIQTGVDGKVWLDADGAVEGVVAFKLGLNNMDVKAAGFSSPEANFKAMQELGKYGAEKKAGIMTYVPKAQVGDYEKWGFQEVMDKPPGKMMAVLKSDISEWAADPMAFAEKQKLAMQKEALANYGDPEKIAVFKSGEPVDGAPFFSVKGQFDEEDKAQIQPLTKQFATDHGDLKKAYQEKTDENGRVTRGEIKHEGAGMVLSDQATGKVIMTKPAGQYGGYETTLPKGTKEPGDTLQETAIKEMYQETGFKTKIVGFLGDYEKSTSVNRF